MYFGDKQCFDCLQNTCSFQSSCIFSLSLSLNVSRQITSSKSRISNKRQNLALLLCLTNKKKEDIWAIRKENNKMSDISPKLHCSCPCRVIVLDDAQNYMLVTTQLLHVTGLLNTSIFESMLEVCSWAVCTHCSVQVMRRILPTSQEFCTFINLSWWTHFARSVQRRPQTQRPLCAANSQSSTDDVKAGN